MRRDFTGIIFIAVIAIAIGVYMFYSGQDASSTFPNNQPSAVIVPFIALAEGSRSKVESRVNYLITTQKELSELWKFLEEPPPVPTVDFNTKVVAAVFAGELPTSGYGIAVIEVQDADKRVVKVELIKPDESCILAQSLTAPYQVIELPKTSLPFTHTDTWTTKTCS
ncbi:MAG: protease complex subunit PrcB family protein [bacterium]|nr:protease complex subunit PrcB family protein [bacterium]